MRVLLVHPPVKIASVPIMGGFRQNYPHIGLAYLASVLRKEGVEVKIFDMQLGYGLLALDRVLSSFNPDMVGVTTTVVEAKRTYEVISHIKKVWDGLVVLGGPHVSAVGAKALEESQADYAVKGEGEYTMLDLVHELDRCNIPGLIWRDCVGEIHENPDRPWIKDLDSLPYPAYDLFELEKYVQWSRERALPMITSRGCPFKCIFCSVKLSMGGVMRYRSPESVVDEMEHWVSKGAKYLALADDGFPVDHKRAERICDLMVERRLKVRWGLRNGMRVDAATPRLLWKMKRAGCVHISYGVETGDDRILKVIKKGITVEQVKRAVKLTSKMNIDCRGFFIVGHPEETPEEFEKSLELAKNLPFDEVRFYNLIPYPGTELYEWVNEHGRWIHSDYLDAISYYDNQPIFDTPYFPEEQRRQAFERGRDLYVKSVLRRKYGRLEQLLWLLCKWKPTKNPLVKLFVR